MWKDIPKFQNKYAVDENGNVINKKTGRYILGDVNSAGYYRVCLSNGNQRCRKFRHRLVAEAFIDNPLNLPEVNHIDGNKTNNSLSNLEWCSREENEHHARETGIKEYRPFLVHWFSDTYDCFEYAQDLADQLGIAKRGVLNYLQGKSMGYVDFGIEELFYL